MGTSRKEQIENYDKRIAELQERKKRLLQAEKQKERKERNHRLIEVGATVESVLGNPIKKEDLIKLKSFLELQERNGHFFSNAMK